jgi:glutaredoxin
MRQKPIVTIYTRPGCHLCEEAKSAMFACGEEFDLLEINIDEDPLASERYKDDIPVVFINGVKAFKHRVDSSLFAKKLRRLGR